MSATARTDGGDGEQHECDHCDESFDTKMGLVGHQQAHTDDVGYARPSSFTGNIDDLREEDLEDLTKTEIRARIGRPLGFSGRYDTPLTLRELNSIYAYFEGRFFFPKRDYGTSRSPPIAELRVQVSNVAPITAYPPEPETGKQPRQYRKTELIQLCRQVEDGSDQRQA